MRCIEIIHGNIGVTTATAININMRCIEIFLSIAQKYTKNRLTLT